MCCFFRQGQNAKCSRDISPAAALRASLLPPELTRMYCGLGVLTILKNSVLTQVWVIEGGRQLLVCLPSGTLDHPSGGAWRHGSNLQLPMQQKFARRLRGGPTSFLASSSSRMMTSSLVETDQPSPHYEEYTSMEKWLDDHPDFTHDYFARKATRTMIDGWLINHAISQSLNQGGGGPGAASPSSFMPPDANSTGSNSRPNSGANTPVRKISAQEFERGGQVLKPMVSTVDGTPTFLGSSRFMDKSSTGKSRRSRAELKALDERELLYELIMDVCNDLDVTSLCHKILQNVSLLLSADRCSLFLVQGEDTDKMCLVSKLFDVSVHSSLQQCVQRSEEIRVPWGTGIIGYVAQTGQVVNIPDAYEVS